MSGRQATSCHGGAWATIRYDFLLSRSHALKSPRKRLPYCSPRSMPTPLKVSWGWGASSSVGVRLLCQLTHHSSSGSKWARPENCMQAESTSWGRPISLNSLRAVRSRVLAGWSAGTLPVGVNAPSNTSIRLGCLGGASVRFGVCSIPCIRSLLRRRLCAVVQRCCFADNGHQIWLVYLSVLKYVYGAYAFAIEPRIKDMRVIGDLCAFGKCQPHSVLQDVGHAQDAVVRPYRHALRP